MKNVFKLIIVVGLSFLSFSCKNFFNSQSFVEELENSMNYSQAAYADVTISSISAATEYISPAAGNYNKSYKASDSINLNFTPTAKYQFAKWSATPEESIVFADAAQTKTKAKIKSSETAITIEPVVYERPVISVSPGNTVENPRNSAIVISFSHAMDVTDEELKNILITVDDIDVSENFEAPDWNKEKTKLTYLPKRDNMIEVGAVAKVVKITVPQSFYYEKDDCKVTLEEDFVYAYKINSKTEDKAEITVTCPSVYGDLSYTGTKTYYLDEELSVTCDVNIEWVISGWSATYADGTLVEDSVLSLETSDDNSEVYVTVLTGASQAITLEPVFVKRSMLAVNFACENGTVTPNVLTQYALDTNFTIKYKEDSDYQFTGWQVLDLRGTPIANDTVLSILSPEALETQCKVIQTGQNITLKATSQKRPKIMAMSPVYDETGANRDSNIKFIFTQTMSQDSIYWTEDELIAEGIPLSWGRKVLVSGKEYYYAIDFDGNAAKRQYKNITVKNRLTGENLVTHFDFPYFFDEERTILIYPSDGVGVAAGIDVEVTVSSNFCNTKGITLSGEFSSCYSTNDKEDHEPPIISVDNVTVQGQNVKYAAAARFGSMDDIVATFAYDNTNDMFWRKNVPWNTTPITKPANKKLKFSFQGIIKDASSIPEIAEIIIEPAVTFLDQKGIRELTVKRTISINPNMPDGKTYSFVPEGTEDPYELEIEWDDKYVSGGYRLTIKAYDSKDNEAVAYWPFIYDAGETSGLVLKSENFNCTDYVIKGINYSVDNYKDFTVNYAEKNTCFSVSVNDTKVTDYFSADEGLKLYTVLGDDWVSDTNGKKSENIKIEVKDIFGNKVLTGDNQTYIEKDIPNGDYPEIRSSRFTKEGSETSRTLKLDIRERCSKLNSFTIKVYSKDYLPYKTQVSGCSTMTTENDTYGDTQAKYILNPDSSEGLYTIGIRETPMNSLEITITDTNGYAQTYELNGNLPEYGIIESDVLKLKSRN